MFLIAFMLCQLPGKPLEEEGGERRRKWPQSTWRFSIMSFLSNSPIKASSGNGPLVNSRFRTHMCCPTQLHKEERDERPPQLLHSSLKARSKTYSPSLNPQLPAGRRCSENQFEYDYVFLRVLNKKIH